jgi:hypothetical protein
VRLARLGLGNRFEGSNRIREHRDRVVHAPEDDNPSRWVEVAKYVFVSNARPSHYAPCWADEKVRMVLIF